NSTLDFDGGVDIAGGNLDNFGTVESEGTNALRGMVITNETGATFKATSGTFTVDSSTMTNTGTVLSTGNGTKLTLLNDTLDDYFGTTGGAIQVDKHTTGSTLELQNTTIDGGHHGAINVDGLIEATAGTANIIKNFDLGNFTVDGKLLVKDSS